MSQDERDPVATQTSVDRWLTVFRGERLFAAGFAAAGVVAIVEGLKYGFIRSDGIIGPGFVPIVVGVVLVLLGVGIIRQTMGERSGSSLMDSVEALAEEARLEAEAQGHVTAAVEKEGSEKSALLVFIGVGVALYAARYIGLILALGVLVLLILLFIEKVGIVRSVAGAALLGFLTWLVFVHFLEVPLAFGVFSPGYS